MNVEELIKKARKNQGNVSQNEIARRLKVSTASISRWTSDGKIADENLINLARLAGEDEKKIVFRYHAETAKTTVEKNFWNRLSGTAASLLIAAPLISSAFNELCILC